MEGFGEAGAISSDFFPLLVFTYLLPLYENFGQKQIQGRAENKAKWLWMGNSGLLDNVGWLQ